MQVFIQNANVPDLFTHTQSYTTKDPVNFKCESNSSMKQKLLSSIIQVARIEFPSLVFKCLNFEGFQ